MKWNINSNLPALLKAIRKRQSLGQIQVAKVLKLEQSSYSRVESGSQKLTAEQWFLFCELTQTPPDAAFLGYIDLLRPIGTQVNNTFALPERYSYQKGSSVRELLPLVNFAQRQWGKKKWSDYLERVKVKPDFFLYLDNEINLNFEMDLGRELIQTDTLKLKDYSGVTDSVSNSSSHGQLRFHYRNVEDPAQRLKKFIGNQKFYEINFNYLIQDEGAAHLDIALTPHEELSTFSYRKDGILHDFLCRYRKNILKSFAEGQDHKNKVQVRELACHYKDAPQCTYQLSFSH